MTRLTYIPLLAGAIATLHAPAATGQGRSIPEKGSARQKLTISPVSMTLPGRRLAAGPAVDMAAANGARTTIGTGLELRLRLPRAAVGADALRDVTGNGGRFRLLFDSIF